MEHEYRIRSVPPTDLIAALKCEADRAEGEGMKHTAERQRKLALHLENAVVTVGKVCGENMRVQVDISVGVVVDVNPILRPEYR